MKTFQMLWFFLYPSAVSKGHHGPSVVLNFSSRAGVSKYGPITAASTSLGNLWEMHVFSTLPDKLNQKLGVGLEICVLTNLSGDSKDSQVWSTVLGWMSYKLEGTWVPESQHVGICHPANTILYCLLRNNILLLWTTEILEFIIAALP